MNEKDVAEALKIFRRHVSVDAPFSESDENSLLDIIQNDQQPSPDNSLMSESLKKDIESALTILSERESEVLKLYFGFTKDHSYTLEEIGDKLNLTRERVRQIKEKAIRRLRHASRSKNLRTYLG